MRNEEYLITTTARGDRFWDITQEVARNCSWAAGPRLGDLMETYPFKSWEKVFIATLDQQVVGFSTFMEIDCIPDTRYGPWIGFVFVAEAHRGKRIGFKIIDSILEYAESAGFKRVYIASNEKGLYEKAGFEFVEYQKDDWGNLEQVFVRSVSI